MNAAGVRSAIAGLIGLAATEEQRLAATADPGEPGDPLCWAALPVIAHNTTFREQQVVRLRAIRSASTPPEFADVDHASAGLYAELAARSADDVMTDAWSTAGNLLAELRSVPDADLLDPARQPWLRGRQLWLQVIVRGFWHPAGHLGEYYQRHGQSDRAVALAEHAVATAAFVRAPARACGMASYNLACARAGAGLIMSAADALATALDLNPDLRANAARDADLAAVRDSSGLATLPATGRQGG